MNRRLSLVGVSTLCVLAACACVRSASAASGASLWSPAVALPRDNRRGQRRGLVALALLGLACMRRRRGR